MAALLDQRVSIVTLGVADLARARRFYEDVLGWAALKDGDPAKIAFYNVGGFLLSLYPLKEFAGEFSGRPRPAGDEPVHGFALAFNTSSPQEVDRIFSDLEAHGVRIITAPHKVFWGGYSGYFADPDGHAWEVAFNPFWETGADGRPVLPA